MFTLICTREVSLCRVLFQIGKQMLIAEQLGTDAEPALLALAVGEACRKAANLMKFGHHNIVKLAGIVCDDASNDVLYLLLEPCEGTLSAFLEQLKEAGNAISVHACIALAADLLSALDYLAAREAIHRFVCPDAILVFRRPDGSLTFKISDVGNVVPEKSCPSADGAGAAVWRAPEVELTSYNCSADVYSAGLVVTTALGCGLVGLPKEPMWHRKAGDRRSMFEMLAGSPLAALEALVAGCTEENPSARLTAKQALHQLRSLPIFASVWHARLSTSSCVEVDCCHVSGLRFHL